MNKAEHKFYEVFTDLQCFILANMNRGDINGVTVTHYNMIDRSRRPLTSVRRRFPNSSNF